MSSDQKLAATPIVGGLFQDIHDYMMGQLRVEDFNQGEIVLLPFGCTGLGWARCSLVFCYLWQTLHTRTLRFGNTCGGDGQHNLGTSVGTRFLTPVMVGLPLVILVNAAIQSCSIS